MMKAIVSLYFLSFLVRLAVLVGTAGFYALADRSHSRSTTGRHGRLVCERSVTTNQSNANAAGIGKLWPGAAQTKIPEAGMTILCLAFECGLPQAGANTSR
jgi:hypothetical protein